MHELTTVASASELRTAGLAAHVEAAVLANASDAVLCEATTSASGGFAADLRKAWLARFRNHILLHRVLRQRMDLDTYMEVRAAAVSHCFGHGVFGSEHWCRHLAWCGEHSTACSDPSLVET